eukprot:scaffold1068_cov227-Chaetoceros_neogracile.AAC.7
MEHRSRQFYSALYSSSFTRHSSEHMQGSGDAESLQRSRILSGIAYIAGIASFWVCFGKSDGLFPYEELLLVAT